MDAQPNTPQLSFHDSLGIMVWLCSHAEYHKEWPLWAAGNDLLPAIIKGQVRIYFDEAQNPFGFITWAWLNDENLKKLGQGSKLEFADWNSGNHLLCHDFVAPWGNAQVLFGEIRSSLFPDQKEFYGIRRNFDGTVRKVARLPVFKADRTE